MMAKYKTEKRKANVGERILITNKDPFEARYENGSSHKVVEVLENGNVRTETALVFLSEYEVIVEAKPSKNARISLLESQVADLTAKVEALEKPKVTTVHNVAINLGESTAKTADAISKALRRLSEYTPKVTSANEQRKAVIERAKAFVKGTINEYQLSDSEISFEVDAKRRAVSVTLSHLFSGKTIVKAIAKCAPDDVFNADIGKAIALGRALGLDVSEFENAVKPTEVVVGMRVYDDDKSAGSAGNVIVEEVRPHGYVNANDGYTYTDGWAWLKKAVIIDDTEAQY